MGKPPVKVSIALVLGAVLFQYTSHGLQIPQFLKKKYGDQYGTSAALDNTGQPEPSQTKTYTKTKKANYGAGNSQRNPYASKSNYYGTKTRTTGGCTIEPPKVLNAGVRCSAYSGCRADCIPSYQFPNGQTRISFVCENGMWIISGNEWPSVPSCQPICLPECQNNGICIAPNQCQCSDNFYGPQCQFESKPCLTYPSLPMNSRRQCTSEMCTIMCMKGHEFPDGSEIAQMVCKNGNWVPTKQKWPSLPDCKATCNPPCLNGGNCLSFNICQCPQEFRGGQCQYSADVCNPKKLPTNGGYNCSGDTESFSCTISCPESIRFEFQPEPVYTCYYSTGVFMPTPIPKCVYPENLEIIPQPESSYTYYVHNRSSGTHFVPRPPYVVPDMSFIPYTESPDQRYEYTISPSIFNDSSVNFAPVEFIHNANQYLTVEQKLPKPASCFHWGGSHYKTFDGQVYSFESKCPHVLVRDSADDTFSVITKNHEDCYFDHIHCHTIIIIYIQDKQYFLKRSSEGIPVFATTKNTLTIPAQLPGIRVEMSAHYIVVSLDSLGVKINWDSHQLVHVGVKENLWNRTEGLCGLVDGDQKNDIMTKDGKRPKNIITAASSWQVDNLESACSDVPVTDHICPDIGLKDSLANKATLFCKKILADTRFAACQSVVDISSMMDSCRWDYCNCDENDRSVCACETLNVYVKDCAQQGVKGLANWRDENICPMHCTGGKVYKPCGPENGQPVCGGAVEVSEEEEDDDVCVEGCYCPETTILHEDKCITIDKCPCRLRGKYFPPGASIPKDCNTCTCLDGIWTCTQVSCGSRCSAIGDPHYITFDGKKYDFMGQCSYYLVKNENFTIEAENVACAGSISEAMNLPPSVSSGLPSCTKTVTVKMNGQIILLKQNHEVVVNGKDISKMPYTVAGINIKSVSSIFILTKLPNGIEIWWDGMTRVYIDLPGNFQGKTRGLCGTSNYNQKDDFLTPEDDVEQAVIPFANKWKTSEKCNDIPEVLSSHPCDKNIHKKATAEKHCQKIKSNLFKDCQWFVDPEQFYQDCLYDMCSCEFKVSKCLCPVVSSYATECSQKGIKIDWRAEIRECGVHCPGGQQYQVCGNSCTRTCFDIAVDPDCKVQCAEGCNCPDSQSLDENGECIPIGQCKCQHDGLDFPPGYKEVRPAPNGPELCTCTNALWKCFLATSKDLKLFPKASDLQSLCDASKNMEFTTCEPVEPVTCKNMHDPDYFSASVCHSGCHCKTGYVLDTISKGCVKPTECPCHHGGKSYKENSTVQSDCNTCICQNGKWKCTDRQCTAECGTWGDSHYKTFDGKHFDYQGQCDYMLAKGNLEGDSFDISIQNVPCGSLGTACSKSVTVKVISGEDAERITLSKNKPVPKYTTYKHLILRERGLFIIVNAPEMGLVLHWDKGTRVYVKVDPKWKGRTKGLCGNYNDYGADDFQTPSGGVSEVSANIFGDSWRLQSYCSEALDINDTCIERPDKKSWAVKKCGTMKNSVFAPCHSEVPVEHFFEKCVFDSCACDQGGDCECLCTAIAAYAQECNNRGVPIKWRSQALCPIQCDLRCSQYSPCVSTCPEETCDNVLINRKLSQTCGEDACIEGCSTKPCPPGFIYTNSSLLDCIPRNVCKPLCMEIGNVTFYEGDLIEEDACHSCYCSLNEKVCKGQPCTTPQPEIFTTHQLEQLLSCKPGWTAWINQDKITSVKTNKRNKKKEYEPLPSLITLNNIKESSRCNITQMVDIECRLSDTHESAKATGLDVECSLEEGLICKSNVKGKLCPDFEIRVLCQCDEGTTLVANCETDMSSKEHPTDCHKFYECTPGFRSSNEWVEKTCGPTMMYHPYTKVCDFPEAVISVKGSCTEKPINKTEALESEGEFPKCPLGTVWNPCAIKCHRLCLYYFYLLRQKGLCKGETKCQEGCVSAEKVMNCPKGTFWANEHTCVSIDECVCMTDNYNAPLKPGETYQGEDCQLCQCIHNSISCHPSTCKPQTATPHPEEGETEIVQLTLPPIIIPTSVTPPPLCEEYRFVDLIQGDQPLLDDAFSASSVLSPTFAPSNSRLNSRVTEKSGGSWAPKYSNQDQYLQIDLGRQEPVYGVIVRGSPLYDEYVTSYKILYSPDGHIYHYILNDDNYPIIFRGSIDTTTPVKQIFETPVEAKIIQINPQTWNNGISLRVELIGCGELTTLQPTTESKKTKPVLKVEHCDDEMGFAKGEMTESQVSVSSELSAEHSKRNLKLNSTSSWQPLTNSPTERIIFDFLEPRNLTGIVTKGGEDGWVTAFTVEFSHDKTNWNPIFDTDMGEKLFLGNYDGIFPHVNSFEIPISAQYIKIIPTKWHENIQMRVEIQGCFKPYPVIAESITTLAPSSACNNCPGIAPPELEMDACRCLVNLWWDGEHCVNRTECPCVVGHISYGVGKVFRKEDCSECICKIGGVEYCTPKKCGPCKEELKSAVTSTCACICQPCPASTVLCHTSNICIKLSKWCDGIQDCPDDELNCPTSFAEDITTLVPITATKKPVKKCSIIICQPGYKKVLRNEKQTKSPLYQSYLSPMVSGQKKTKATIYFGVKNSYKGASKRFNLPRPPPVLSEIADEEEICPEYKCVLTKPPPKYVYNKNECPPTICQAGYFPLLDDDTSYMKTKVCPTYSCYPPPAPDAVCNVTGRTFNTFDGTEYKYDICNHVLARDLEADEWDISLKKNCRTSCSRNLIIRHRSHLFVIHPDLTVEFDGFRYTVEQTKNIGQQNQGFGISQLGNTLLFVSNRYGFWIIWNKLADVKLGVVHKRIEKVDGLCGFFSDNPDDDKRRPNGNPTRTSTEFGDSWALASDQPSICEAKACPIQIQNKAWEMCNRVKEHPLSLCAKVLDIEQFISRCLETTCTCLQNALDNHTAEEECRCQSMQAFVVDCLSADNTIDISDWRMQQDCPTSCESPLVYQDCYQRKCEPTCQSIHDPTLCPKINNICFPGCYCPSGYVRKDDTCIKPSSCRDCECNVLPHLQYVTYDENNFTVSGNCVYIMSRDILEKDQEKHKFQVLVTNHPCRNKPDQMCVGKITILYESHKVHILLDEHRNKLKLIVDSERISDFDDVAQWSTVRETAIKHFQILLIAIQVEVSIYYPSLGVSVKAPSHKYGGRLEGLCGDCNGDKEDDIRTPNGNTPEDLNDFALSWLYENLPGGQTREQCENEKEDECPPFPVESDPCIQLVDINKFGQCLNVLDPLLFIEWCRKDTCGGHPEQSCSAIEAFARDCASSGFCINWRNEYCPSMSCPSDHFYDPCGTSKPETCESIKDKGKKIKNERIIPTEGCYCPEGKVFLNDTCVLPKDCEVCDKKGHHASDVWKEDKCTTCMCEGTNLRCETQHCSGPSTICEQGYNAIQLPLAEEECCEKYACVPEPTAGPTCETPQKLLCGPGQILKLNTKPNGCQAFVCECKPAKDCDPIDLTTSEPTEPGYVKEVDDSGCCPEIKLICKSDLCDVPKECPEFHSLKKDEIEGKCCPLYSCEPPRDKCIFGTEFTAADKGGPRRLTKLEKQKLLKNANDTWNDGPCRDCKCSVTGLGNYQPTCSEIECPSIKTHSEYSDYELILQPVHNQCCGNVKRIACKHNSKIYEVGQKWPKGNDYCTTMECVETPTGVQKETQVKSCENRCDIGFEYVEAAKESKECCGTCKQVACVDDDIVHYVGEEWTSEDYCVNYYCANITGSIQIQAVVVNCPDVVDQDDFIITTVPVEGKCCDKHIKTACKVGEQVYKVGESWPSPDGDKCKKFTCAEKENKGLMKQEEMQRCKKDCALGWEYQELDSACCGECKQIACVINGELKQPSITWTSNDNCTTYSCEKLDDQFSVTSREETCPMLENCPAENIYTKGCCQLCNITSESQTMCVPQPIELERTVGILNVTFPKYGLCTNEEPIPQFTECVGSCPSSTLFNIRTATHESTCYCCQATAYESLVIELTCKDGSTRKKKVAIPSKCACGGCAESQVGSKKVAVKSGIKSPYRR